MFNIMVDIASLKPNQGISLNKDWLAIPLQLHGHFLTAVKLQMSAVLQTLVTKLLYMAVLRTLRIYLFLAEPKTTRVTAEVSSFMKRSV